MEVDTQQCSKNEAQDELSSPQRLAVRSPDATSDAKLGIQAQIKGRIRKSIKEQSGPSFEERIAKAAAKFRQEAKETEERQKLMIQSAKERAQARPTASPVRKKEMTPPSPEERAQEHARVIAENMRNYQRQKKELKRRLGAREPLFKVSEVNAAFEMQRLRQEERKRQLQAEEEERWRHIQELQAKVIDRPTLLEDYERTVHLQSAPDIRLIPESAKETKLERKMRIAVSQAWFQESAWGKEVLSIRDRQNTRPRLHEIPYPPKATQVQKLPPRILQPIDSRMDSVISQPWYQKSQWCESVKEMRERQKERPKLHEQ